jgi:S1-C subfamily serine protease
MIATLRRLLLVSAGAIALSASGLAQVSPDIAKALSQAQAAYDRADYGEAVRWFRVAADQGNPWAQWNLGEAYEDGRGVPQDMAEAVRWYRLVADRGLSGAQYKLGEIFYDAQNYAPAESWFRLAADQGLVGAQYNLGSMYANGQGVPQNDVEAYKWWSLAAAQGDSGAAKNRDIVRSEMTPAQIAEGQRLAAEWKPRLSASAAAPSAAREESAVAGEIEGTGSGFFVTAAGHILTNAHVVEGCTRISLAGGSTLTVLDIDLGSDLALLKKGGTSVTAPLMLRQGRGVRLADNVVVAGFPLSGLLSSGLNVTTGAVSALAGPGDDRRLIQITAPVQPGNSGGPLLDSSGNVVGVVVSKLDALEVASITGDIPQNVNFAISLGTLQAFLDSNDVDYQTRASSSPRSNADVAELAKAATVQIQCRG